MRHGPHTMKTGWWWWKAAGVSACPVDYELECEVKPRTAKFPLVGAGGDRTEHVGQKTVGHGTREGANVEIAFEEAKVRRPLLSVDSLVEKGQMAVFTDAAPSFRGLHCK